MKSKNVFRILSVCLLVIVLSLWGCGKDDPKPELPKTDNPYIEFTTAKAVGDSIKLIINAAPADQAKVWIDLNNNAVQDAGEQVTTFTSDYSFTSYTLGAQTVRVYGKVSFLYCYANQLSSLEVSKNTNLKVLNCGSNQLSSLDISKNTNLEELYCRANQLSTLDVSRNTKLEYLNCLRNQLSSLEVSHNTKLKYLNCLRNQLSSLEVSHNTKLEYLNCSYNQLSSLDVSQNKELGILYCDNNQLSSLDVSQNTKLVALGCDGNPLSSLDVSQNTKLKELYCDNNPNLTCIKVNATQKASIPLKWRKDATAAYNISCP